MITSLHYLLWCDHHIYILSIILNDEVIGTWLLRVFPIQLKSREFFKIGIASYDISLTRVLDVRCKQARKNEKISYKIWTKQLTEHSSEHISLFCFVEWSDEKKLNVVILLAVIVHSARSLKWTFSHYDVQIIARFLYHTVQGKSSRSKSMKYVYFGIIKDMVYTYVFILWT